MAHSEGNWLMETLKKYQDFIADMERELFSERFNDETTIYLEELYTMSQFMYRWMMTSYELFHNIIDEAHFVEQMKVIGDELADLGVMDES